MTSPQSPLTSRIVAAQVRRAAEAHGLVFDASASKTALLEQVRARAGVGAVFVAGYASREWPTSPITGALLRAHDPAELMLRWQRLERFGHTRHRTRTLASSSHALQVRHEARGAEPPPAVDDVFVWGMLAGLLHRFGVVGMECHLADGTILMTNDTPCPVSSLPTATHDVHFRWGMCTPTATSEIAVAGDARSSERPVTVAERVTALIQRDVARAWRLPEAARALAMSPRALQRALREQQTTWGAQLLQARVATAVAMLRDPDRTVSEVAFAAGFADAAHFTRSCRRLLDVPPLAVRVVDEPG